MDAWKLVLPEADREKALAEYHNTPQLGHLGVDKTFARVATYYYWPGYYRDVRWYDAAYQVCQAHKSSQQAPAGLMTERNLEGPWIVVASDIMSPKPPSVLKAFEELIVNRWGCPWVLLTDNDTEFSNRLVTERLDEYGTLKSTIPPYHAQANPVERVN